MAVSLKSCNFVALTENSTAMKAITLVMAMAFALATGAQTDSVFIYSPNQGAGLRVAAYEADGWRELGQLCSSD